MKTISRICICVQRIRFPTTLGLATAVAMTGGCSSYHQVSPQQIQARPEIVINERVRADVVIPDSTVVVKHGRSAWDRIGLPAVMDTVAATERIELRVAAVEYPIVSGSTPSEARLYAKDETPLPVRVDLNETQHVAIRKFDYLKTGLWVGGVALIVVGLLNMELKMDFGPPAH